MKALAALWPVIACVGCGVAVVACGSTDSLSEALAGGGADASGAAGASSSAAGKGGESAAGQTGSAGSSVAGSSSSMGGRPATGGCVPLPTNETESPGVCSAPTPGPIGGSKKAPDLTPGMWKSLTPPDLKLGAFGIIDAAIDPSNPYTIYVAGGDDGGIYKTEDGGSTWVLQGTPGAPVKDCATTYLYNVYHIAVNPCDSKNLYATAGVRGDTQGFWVSKDGGATWVMPQGFSSIAGSTATLDVTSMAVDPEDFKHVLVGSHSAWKGMGNAGILETTDGGKSWTAHAPNESWPPGTGGLTFLSNATGGVDKRAWLYVTDGAGFWRTTDAGASWAKVSDNEGVHGGVNFYRSKTGAIYTGGFGYPQRSTDNGASWSNVSQGMPYGYYQTVHGDGNLLYSTPACACSGADGTHPYFTSAEDDGLTWTPYKGGAQTFGNGPFTLVFDKNTRIMYSVQWAAGVWALKVE